MSYSTSKFKSNMANYVEEMINPSTYYDWLNKNTTISGVPFTVEKYPFQKAILEDMHINMCVTKPSQVGLPLALTTPVFTTEGWKQLGQVQVGDLVYTPKGEPTRVVYLSPIQTDSPCYEVTFCDGTKIVADENHRWFVHSDKAFNLHGLADQDAYQIGRITTKAIFENYKTDGQNIFYVPTMLPLKGKHQDFPFDMYELGYSLGEGEAKELGFNLLDSSNIQRLAFLSGLLDSKCSTTNFDAARFHLPNSESLDIVVQVLSSLGLKVIVDGDYCSYDSDYRKPENYHRRIVDVKPVAPVPVRCIMVDDAEHQFVCSKAFITTSNTEIQIRKALALVARNPHRNLIFTLPNKNMVQRLYQTRVQHLLDSTEAFNPEEVKKPTRSIEITQIGSSFFLMFPANEQAATSQPADIVFNDEVDLSDQDVLALFNSRTQGSDWKMIQEFSTPTYANYGISSSYEKSDQHVYMFQCPHCNHYQIPKFTSDFMVIPKLPTGLIEDFSNFDFQWVDKYDLELSKAHAKCEKCHRPVAYGDPKNHQWVAKYPRRTDNRGYQVSPFSTSQITPSYILGQLAKYRKNDNIKGFKNTVLGVEHEDGDERLAAEIINLCFTSHVAQIFPETESERYFIGIDMGNLCHVTISRSTGINHTEVVYFGIVKKEELRDRVLNYLKLYPNLVLGFIDRLPLISDSEGIREISYRKIMPVQYGTSNSTGTLITPKKDEYGILNYYLVQRTNHIDKLVTAIKNGWITFSGYGIYRDMIVEHLRDMVRKVIDDNGEKMPVWEKLKGQDHFFHSLAYMYQAVYQYYEGDLDGTRSTNSFLYLAGFDSNIMQPANKSIYG